MPITPEYRLLCKQGEGINASLVFMTYISKEEEDLIDNLNNNTLILERGQKTFDIKINQIFCYGEVNFNDINDLNTIENFNFLSHLGAVGIHIYHNYDYNTHTCSSSRKSPFWTETWSPSEVARFAHGCLGKPERIVLFKTR